ncbi:MAG: hypothetical protein U1F58_09110 [Burkholderiales bacterium]
MERHAKRRPDAPYSPDDWPPHPDHGRYWCGGEDGYHVAASLPQVERALKILDALTKALVKSGFRVLVKEPDRRNRNDRAESRLIAEKSGEQLHYRMWESYSRRYYTAKEHAAAKKESRYLGSVEYIPNGTFVLELTGAEYRIEQMFRETKTRTLDLELPDIVTKFLEAVPRQKALREERLAQERAWQEAAQRRREEENRIREEKTQVESLLEEAGHARRFAELRSYLDAVEREAMQDGGITDAGRKWLVEARRLIERYDPMLVRLGPSPAVRDENDSQGD